MVEFVPEEPFPADFEVTSVPCLVYQLLVTLSISVSCVLE